MLCRSSTNAIHADSGETVGKLPDHSNPFSLYLSLSLTLHSFSLSFSLCVCLLLSFFLFLFVSFSGILYVLIGSKFLVILPFTLECFSFYFFVYFAVAVCVCVCFVLCVSQRFLLTCFLFFSLLFFCFQGFSFTRSFFCSDCFPPPVFSKHTHTHLYIAVYMPCRTFVFLTLVLFRREELLLWIPCTPPSPLPLPPFPLLCRSSFACSRVFSFLFSLLLNNYHQNATRFRKGEMQGESAEEETTATA